MPWDLSPESLFALAAHDEELNYRLNGFDGTICVTVEAMSVWLRIANGRITAADHNGGEARITVTLPSALLKLAAQSVPPPLLQGILIAQSQGVRIEGDMIKDVAPYMGALNRVFNLLRIAYGGVDDIALPRNGEPFRDTDTAVGRYTTVTVDGVDYRIFYEESGSGDRALLLQHTAGADGRQWRHQLADPEFQRRFRVIAYDLPFHGRSLPPTSQSWWTGRYQPSEDWLMKIVVALADRLGLNRPLFMGCSVGGQLALDLAAHYGARFGGFLALNGTLDYPSEDTSFNDLCRHPAVPNDFYAMGNLGATSPFAVEAFRRELFWIYRSNGHGIYAGDNDYFMGHDLKRDGHLIDGARTPTYVLAGEYDPVAADPDHGGPAVAARYPSVIYRVMKGLSHFAPTDDPIGFRNSIIPVLDEITAKLAAAR